jgi:hypothetical protein
MEQGLSRVLKSFRMVLKRVDTRRRSEKRSGSTVNKLRKSCRRLRVKQMGWKLAKRARRTKWPKMSRKETTTWSLKMTRKHGVRVMNWQRRRKERRKKPAEWQQAWGRKHPSAAAAAKSGRPDPKKSKGAMALEGPLLALLVRMGRVPKHKADAEAGSTGTESTDTLQGGAAAAAAACAATLHKASGERRHGKKSGQDGPKGQLRRGSRERQGAYAAEAPEWTAGRFQGRQAEPTGLRYE